MRGVEFPGAYRVECGVEKIASYALLKAKVRMTSFPTWHPKESTVTLEMQRNCWTSICPMQTAEICVDATSASHGSATQSDSSGEQQNQIGNLPAGYVYSPTSLASAEFFNLDASALDSQQNTDFDPYTLTDEGTSTGYYTISCVVMPATSILKARGVY
jgi:hypothetical protein